MDYAFGDMHEEPTDNHGLSPVPGLQHFLDDQAATAEGRQSQTRESKIHTETTEHHPTNEKHTYAVEDGQPQLDPLDPSMTMETQRDDVSYQDTTADETRQALAIGELITAQPEGLQSSSTYPRETRKTQTPKRDKLPSTAGVKKTLPYRTLRSGLDSGSPSFPRLRKSWLIHTTHTTKNRLRQSQIDLHFLLYLPRPKTTLTMTPSLELCQIRNIYRWRPKRSVLALVLFRTKAVVYTPRTSSDIPPCTQQNYIQLPLHWALREQTTRQAFTSQHP